MEGWGDLNGEENVLDKDYSRQAFPLGKEQGCVMGEPMKFRLRHEAGAGEVQIMAWGDTMMNLNQEEDARKKRLCFKSNLLSGCLEFCFVIEIVTHNNAH